MSSHQRHKPAWASADPLFAGGHQIATVLSRTQGVIAHHLFERLMADFLARDELATGKLAVKSEKAASPNRNPGI